MHESAAHSLRLDDEGLLVWVALEELRPRGEAVAELAIPLRAPRRVGEVSCVLSLLFEVPVEGGKLGLSDETTDCGYFSEQEVASLDLMRNHIERIKDIFAEQPEAFFR